MAYLVSSESEEWADVRGLLLHPPQSLHLRVTEGLDGDRERPLYITGLGPPSFIYRAPQAYLLGKGHLSPAGTRASLKTHSSLPSHGPETLPAEWQGPAVCQAHPAQCPPAVQPLAKCFHSLKLRRPLSTWLCKLQLQPSPTGGHLQRPPSFGLLKTIW